MADEERVFRPGCRFYEKEYPDVDDVVIVKVKNIAEMGAYVSLLEYNNIEGMILMSELSRRRIRSINKIIRVGKIEAVMVIRVDKEKGYIDLSKRRVAREDVAKCEDKYNKAKTVHSILRHVAEKLRGEEELEDKLYDLYTRIGWPLYRSHIHAYDAFKLCLSDPESVLGPLDAPQEDKDLVLVNIQRRLVAQALKLRADIQVTCFEYEGIEAIKAALHAGMAVSTADIPIKIQLIAPPLYVLLTSTREKEAGLELMNSAIEAIRTVITEKGGSIEVKMEPKVTNAADDTALSKLLEGLERENAEISGDEDSDEEAEDK